MLHLRCMRPMKLPPDSILLWLTFCRALNSTSYLGLVGSWSRFAYIPGEICKPERLSLRCNSRKFEFPSNFKSDGGHSKQNGKSSDPIRKFDIQFISKWRDWTLNPV